jgi:hypothetical protein
MDKVNALTVQLRRLWPKYDTELNQYVAGMHPLLQLFEHFFMEAKLTEDFQEFQAAESGSIEELIYRACGVTADMI